MLNSGLSHSYSTQRDKKLISGYAVNNRRFDDRLAESNTTLATQVCLHMFKIFVLFNVILLEPYYPNSSLVWLICFAFFHLSKGIITHLSEQISSLNDRMDEFTSRVEELNSKLSIKKQSPSQQNLALQTEACNGSAPTSYFLSSLGNGTLTGSIMPNSASSSQLAKESPLMEEVPVAVPLCHSPIKLLIAFFQSLL